MADFLATLAEMNRGRFILECGSQLSQLCDAVINTSGKGKLTLTLEVAPSGIKDGRVNQVEIRPVIRIVRPEPNQGRSIFFIVDGKLTRDDPDQMDIDYDSPARREANK